jgi:hypothetical protein
MPRLIVALICCSVLSACDSITGSSDIEYSIQGSAGTRVSITYESGSGVSQIADRAVPWSYSLKAKRDDFLYVSAQIISQTGSITVSIRKGSSTWKTATASGFAAIATASGSLD